MNLLDNQNQIIKCDLELDIDKTNIYSIRLQEGAGRDDYKSLLYYMFTKLYTIVRTKNCSNSKRYEFKIIESLNKKEEFNSIYIEHGATSSVFAIEYEHNSMRVPLVLKVLLYNKIDAENEYKWSQRFL